MFRQQREDRSRLRRWAVWSGLATGLLAAATAALAMSGLVFDPPPGDVYPATVRNDELRQVVVFGCWNDTCTQGYDPSKLSPGQTEVYNEDRYAPDDIGIAEPHAHQLLGCLTPPRVDASDQPLTSTTVRTSQLHSCVGQRLRQHPSVTFVHP